MTILKSRTELPEGPRRAIIVGASSGIGAALAHRLAAEGYHLALLARRAELLETLCAGINSAYGENRALFFVHDVTIYDSVPGLLQDITAALGGLDLFIYNSGISFPNDLEHYDFEKDRRITEVNYMGALAWLNPVAAMFSQQKNGTIVGISSVAGERGRVGKPAYNASKAALNSYLESLRNRLTRLGVHVLTIKPGYVRTGMTSDMKNPFFIFPVERAAADICNAIHKRRQVVYTPPIWWLAMFVVRNIPSLIFRHLSF
jgi:short-subunit dehydrogenase